MFSIIMFISSRFLVGNNNNEDDHEEDGDARRCSVDTASSGTLL